MIKFFSKPYVGESVKKTIGLRRILFSFCNLGIPYSRGVVASEFFSLAWFFCDLCAFEQIVNKSVDMFGCGCSWVGFKMFVSFLIIQYFLNLVIIPLCLRLCCCYLCKPW